MLVLTMHTTRIASQPSPELWPQIHKARGCVVSRSWLDVLDVLDHWVFGGHGFPIQTRLVAYTYVSPALTQAVFVDLQCCCLCEM